MLWLDKSCELTVDIVASLVDDLAQRHGRRVQRAGRVRRLAAACVELREEHVCRGG